MATTTSNNQLSGTPSSTTSTFLSPPDSIPYDHVGLNFAETKKSFTGLVKQLYNNSNTGAHPRKLMRLELTCYINTSLTRRMTAYLYDEWAEIMDYFWNKACPSSKHRECQQMSITFYGVRVEKIRDEDVDPVHDKHIAFVLDKDTPNDPDIWIEFKTCCNRICGRNGIRLTKQDVINHLNESGKIEIVNNANINYLTPCYQYLPLSELKPSEMAGYLYGFITMAGNIKPCQGRHNFSQQLRIRDATLAWDEDDFQVMLFGNTSEQFPNCRESDLIRIHRCKIQYRMERQQWQGVVALDKKFITYIVIDGNLTMPNNKECVRHSSSENYTFEELVDGYFVKYLKESCRIRQERLNPDLLQMRDTEEVRNIPNVLGVNQNMFMYLNEIEAVHERINVVVMIVKRLDVEENEVEDDTKEEKEDEIDMDINGGDTMEFYWVIWDGSNCEDKQGLFQLYDMKQGRKKKKGNDNGDAMDIDEDDGGDDDHDDDNKWDSENIYNNPKIIGSAVKMLVSPDYETAIQCYNDIPVGSWVELSNIKVDGEKKELIYDERSKIFSKVHLNTNKFIQQRLDLIYYNIQENTNIITLISSIIPHHQYQSFTAIKTILTIKEPYCRYRIRGKCIRYHPFNIQQFSQKKNEKYRLQFVLCIQDSENSMIDVIFEGDEAKRFFGIDEIQDLTKQNSEQLQDIGHCMEIIMNEASMMDLCLRSYKVKSKNFIAYKAIDTVLIK